ncbi:MAG TPA: tetratricopeptide repeat protein [Rhodocyclaceae bacterium]|nr:tetratricopeptide repeat protein [Rhodocyclaceae bacterium]
MLPILLEQGKIAKGNGEIEKALSLFKTAIQIEPHNIVALRTLGSALEECGQLTEALAIYSRAIHLARDVDLLNERGAILRQLGQYEQAITDYRHALTLDANNALVRYNLSIALLSTGQFDEGWQLYESRWDSVLSKYQRRFGVPQWRGDFPLTGRTILLHAEQGFGDTFQFLRYTKLVADQGAHVIMAVDRSQHTLAQRAPGVSTVLSNGDTFPPFDCHSPLMSLPFCLQTTQNTIFAPQRYLFADSERVEHWKSKLGVTKVPRVGLAWSGSVGHKNDRNRSIPLETLQSALASDRHEFISLQNEIRASDKKVLEHGFPGQHFGAALNFDETAALIENLDLVIGVDTSVIHLAAAMGKPCWLLLSHVADWRWLTNRDDSLWYPSMRLFRQTHSGDWREALRKIRQQMDLMAR